MQSLDRSIILDHTLVLAPQLINKHTHPFHFTEPRLCGVAGPAADVAGAATVRELERVNEK